MANDDKKMMPLGCLRFRVEDGYWCAYLCKDGSMDEAILIGSIAMPGVRNLDRKREFMALMRSVIDDLCVKVLTEKPIWSEPQAAPESDPSGIIQ